MEELRARIAEVDQRIVELVGERMRLAEQIGKLKQRMGVDVVNVETEAAVVSRIVSLGDSMCLERSFTNRLAALLIEEAVWVQDPSIRTHPFYQLSLLPETCEKQVRESIRLDLEEATFPQLEETERKLHEATMKGPEVDTPPIDVETIKEAVRNWLNQEYGLDLDSEQILLTPNRRAAAFAAIVAIVPQGGRAVIPTPSPPLYGGTVQLVGGRVYTLHTRIEEEWGINLEKLGNLLRINPEVIILSVPNNPTGKVYSKETLQEVFTMVKRTGTFLIADETYSTNLTKPLTSLLKTGNPNSVYLGTFPPYPTSWSHSIGYAVSDRDTVRRMEQIMLLSGNRLSNFHWPLLKAFQIDPSLWQEYERELQMRVTLAAEKLKQLPVSYVLPDSGLHFFIKIM
ncbi:MAG: aminotransferase class I/II-fold pyridoxal phosphate-dependent enzyme, partial [Candidatus Bathyarchaeia archaeon]